jgi:glycosyltransferase involved in cell wall biosynthesis
VSLAIDPHAFPTRSVSVLAVTDVLDPSAGSGTPHALYAELKRRGIGGPTIDAGLPRWRRRLVEAAGSAVLVLGSPRLLRSVGTDSFRAQLNNSELVLRSLSRRTARLVGRLSPRPSLILQYGSNFTHTEGVPFATYEDMTVVQASRVPDWPHSQMSSLALRKRIDYQREAYRRACVCFTTTEWAKHSIVSDYAISESKVVVVGVGRNHQPLVVDRDWRTPRFLFIGRDWRRKNGPALLRAIAVLRKEIPGVELNVVGNAPTGLSQSGVTFHGSLELNNPVQRRVLESLFGAATCFVLPSLHEPSAISYVEAMSAGIPVIGTSEGGSSELIGNAGIVIDPHSDEALLDALRVMANGPHAQSFARHAVIQAAPYTWAGVIDRMLATLPE